MGRHCVQQIPESFLIWPIREGYWLQGSCYIVCCQFKYSQKTKESEGRINGNNGMEADMVAAMDVLKND
jgi:hypothetical protein